mmetsp:Transcript_21086/g.39633  ORF Transcript_21086/g.39633 Transcript_21086/m.39633 type:complete len:253 (-) Transcript_21086:353-1111(-)
MGSSVHHRVGRRHGSFVQAQECLVEHGLLLGHAHILQSVHETHVEVGQGDVVRVLAERVLQFFGHFVQAPQTLEEEEAKDGSNHVGACEHDDIDRDQQGEGHQQQPQKLCERQGKWHISDLQAVVEAEHAVGQLLVHSRLDWGSNIDVLHGIGEIPNDPIHRRGDGVVGFLQDLFLLLGWHLEDHIAGVIRICAIIVLPLDNLRELEAPGFLGYPHRGACVHSMTAGFLHALVISTREALRGHGAEQREVML